MTKTAYDPYAMLVAKVFRAAGEMRRAGETIAAEVGQTQARWQLIWVVSRQAQTVPDAARELGVTRQSVQRLADELVAESVIEFVANPRHQRSPLMRLTSRGAGILEKLTVAARRHNRRIIRSFGEDELNEMRTLLDRIVSALQQVS